MRRGISPVIATVILIAVTLVLAVALAGWAMGVWSGVGSTEALQISGVISKVGNYVWVNATIINKGTAPANITKVVMYDQAGKQLTNTSPNAIVMQGQTLTQDFTMSPPTGATGQVAVGQVYEVRFYTSSGNEYVVLMKCVKA